MKPSNRKYRQPAKTGPDKTHWTPEEVAAHEHKQRLATPVAEMSLNVRVINTLEDNGVILAEQLLRETYESLMKMQNFGTKTMTEVRAAVAALKLPIPSSWKKPVQAKVRPPKPKKNSDPLW